MKQKVYAHCNGQNNKHLNSRQYTSVFFIAKHLAHCLYVTIVNEQIKPNKNQINYKTVFLKIKVK